jgi:prophage regulatory protein
MKHDNPAAYSGPYMMRLPEVMKCTGLARTSILEKVKDGTFPKPSKLSKRAVGWSSAEVGEWIAARLAARDTEVA